MQPIGRVVVCTPSLDGNVSMEFLIAMLGTVSMCSNFNITVDFASLRGDCFIGKARNNLVNQFLATEGESLFFIDADQGWDVDSFLRMVLDPHEIVAGAVPKKQDDVTFNNVHLDTDASNNCFIEGGLLRASRIGTGFMRIKRSAIEKMIAAYPEKYSPGDGSDQKEHYRLFESGVVDGLFWGEDLAFCNKWTALGEHIWIDPNINFKHVGRKSWTGNYLEYLQQTCKVEVSKPALASVPDTGSALKAA